MYLLPIHALVWLLIAFGVGVPMVAMGHSWVWLFLGSPEFLALAAGYPICFALARRNMWVVKESTYFTHEPESETKRLRLQWLPRWAWPWSNDEDGVLGDGAFSAANRELPAWQRAFIWSALRNPVNNLRFVFPFGIRINPDSIRFMGNSLDVATDLADGKLKRILWSYVWQGIFAGFDLVIRLPRKHALHIRGGYKLMGRDKFGVPAEDYRSVSCGTAAQIQILAAP